MNKEIDVSVVIVNWNTKDLLHQTLQTLYKNTHGITFETIVVDNGSSNGSVDMVRKLWKQVKLIQLPENKGFTVANNEGFDKAKGRFILLLNSDTIVTPTTLPGMVRFLETHPDAGCVGCKHLNPDKTLQRSMDNFPSLLNDFLSYTELHRLQIFQPLLKKKFAWWSDYDKVCEVDWVNGSCMMVRREAIKEIGGLDETFFIYAEEIDWCYRMKEHGWKVYFTPEATIIHIGGQAMNRAANKRIVLKYKGQYRFYRKHYSIFKYIALRIIVTLIVMVRIAILCMMYLLPKKLKKRWELITQEPMVIDIGTMLHTWWQIITLPL